MNVRETIAELSKIENQNLEVCIYNEEKDRERQNPFEPLQCVSLYSTLHRAKIENFPECVTLV